MACRMLRAGEDRRSTVVSAVHVVDSWAENADERPGTQKALSEWLAAKFVKKPQCAAKGSTASHRRCRARGDGPYDAYVGNSHIHRYARGRSITDNPSYPSWIGNLVLMMGLSERRS